MIELNKDELFDLAYTMCEASEATEKARMILGDLCNTLTSNDPKKLRENMIYEAERVFTYIEIAFDYVIKAEDLCNKASNTLNS